jgi:LuxR family maltose regulon positive regulatory protein
MVDQESCQHPGSPPVPVATAKIVVPRVSAGWLRRPRLVEQLDRAGAQAILLVCAPAGYGKTLLLADWVAADPTRTAWVSLDEDDNDDRRFWAAVLAAVLACPLLPPGSPLHEIRLPTVPSRDPDFLPAFLDALHDLPGPVRLVLDDVHELTAADPLHGLAALLRDRPPMLQIVLATRSDPPVHLDRLRLAGVLHEIRAGELAFSFDEASVLMDMTNVDVREDQVRLVLEQTDGWAAGLRLAALSLRESDDRDAFLTDLVGNGRAISDYLVGEILSRLTDEVVDLLSAVCVCDHLTAPLAVALSGQDDAAELLIALERETSLVVSYGEGRRWFRIHPLLRAHLRADVRRRRPDLLSTLEARAARWFAAAQDPVGALRHARAAEDPDLTDELLRRHGIALATSGHHDAVIETLDAAAARRPADAMTELVGALAWTERGDAAAAGRHLARAEAVWPAEPAAPLTSLRTLVEARRTWTDAPRADARTARTGRLAEDPVDEQVDLLVHANAALAVGDARRAEEAARAATARAISDGNSYLAARSLTTLSMAVGITGDVGRMIDIAEQAERSAPADRWRSTEGAVLNAVVRGYGALLQARPEEGLRLAEGLVVVDVRPDGPPPLPGGDTLRPMIEMLRAAARFDLGGGPWELDAMRAARLATPTCAALQMTAATGALLEHGAAVWLRRGDRAREVLGWAEERFGPTGEVVFFRAIGPAATNRYHVAREHLRPLLEGSLAPVIPWALVEGWLLECDIALAVGARPRARSALRRALAAAAEVGVLRPLVYAPPRVAGLLVEQVGEFGALEGTAHDVLAVRWARERVPVLTGRETTVLTLLPTQLSFEEIARDLGLSVNTVKSHVKAVYGKLGVGSRRSAVGAARTTGLIESPPNC